MSAPGPKIIDTPLDAVNPWIDEVNQRSGWCGRQSVDPEQHVIGYLVNMEEAARLPGPFSRRIPLCGTFGESRPTSRLVRWRT